VRVNGVDLHYTVEGEGFPCLVPRPANTSVIERTFSARLREKLQLIIFDPRGCGRSGGSLADSSLDDLLADIDGLRAALGHERIGLLGWSIFSLVGMDFALAYPNSVSRLILIGGLPSWPDSDDYRYWETVASPERKVRLAANLARLEGSGVEPLPPGAPEPDQLVRRWAQTLRYAAYGPRYWYDATFDCAPLYADDEWDMAQWDWLVAQVAPRHPNAAAIAGVKPPTFLAQGVWDFNAPPTRWAGVLETFRDCTYVAFERSGHYPFYEERELFDKALLEWLAAPRGTDT
jgi:pimeloyl-ACP methyl ester carboxylesterase